MPRDSSGNMSLPATNPVVADTDITTTWANGTMSDLAAEVEDSLSRSGKGGMLVPFQNMDGTVSAPGVTFTNDTGTGLYRPSGGLAVTVGGVLHQLWASALTTFKKAVKFDDAVEISGTLTLTGSVSGLTKANLPSVGQVTATNASGTTAITSSSFTLVSSQTVDIVVATSRPVWVGLLNASDTVAGYLAGSKTDAGEIEVQFLLKRGVTGAGTSTAIALTTVYGLADGSATRVVGVPPGSLYHIDSPGAGNWTYSLYAKIMSTNTSAIAGNVKIFAYEM